MMNINGIQKFNIQPLKTPLIKPYKTETSISGDNFIKSPDNDLLEAKVKELLKKLEPSLSSSGNPVIMKDVFSITNSGVSSIPVLPDGGFLVEKETETVVYYGDAAKKFLEKNTYFDSETEVIIPSNGSLRVTYNGQSMGFNQSGAILIGANTEASFEVEGNPLVIRTKRPPSWYKKLGPEGEHKDKFDNIAMINQHIFASHTLKTRFPAEQLKMLLQGGIVETVDAEHVKWSNFKDDDDLRSHLIGLGFKGRELEDIPSVWLQTKQRQLQSRTSGSVNKKNFSDGTLKKLVDGNILKQFLFRDDNYFWLSYSTEEQLRSKLEGCGITGSEAMYVVNVWKKTNSSGYDNTGLIWDKGNIVAYMLNNKTNLWNEQNTEWIVNSTAYAGNNEPFTVGVSNVVAKENYTEPVPFRDLRPGEALHRHPLQSDKKQTEGYLVTGGRAALLTIVNGKPHISILETGDMAVINPGVTHCVVGIDGPYEHLVFQVPSAFQYGLMFKDTQKYENYGIDENEILQMALDKLKSGEKNNLDFPVPSSSGATGKNDNYLLHDGFDSSRDITGFKSEEGKADEPYKFTMNFADLQYGAENGNLDAYILLGVDNKGKTSLPDGISGTSKQWNLAIGAYDNNNFSLYDENGNNEKQAVKEVHFDASKDTLEVSLDKRALRNIGWHDGEELTIQPFTTKDFSQKITDTFDEILHKPWDNSDRLTSFISGKKT